MVQISSSLPQQGQFLYQSSPFVPRASLRLRSNVILHASISDSTKTSYNTALRSFDRFRAIYSFPVNWPPTMLQVTDFIAYLSFQGYASNTISTYVSGISYKCKSSNLFDPTQNFVVRKMLTGLNRLDKRCDPRMPITLPILTKIVLALPTICSSTYETKLFSALFTTAFFGFFRVGELVQNSFMIQGHALLFENVKYLPEINSVEIKLFSSKTDQTGRGSIIIIPPSNSNICPVKALKSFLNVRPPFLGTFFRHHLGNPVTRYQFVAVLKKCLSSLNIDPSYYSSHSFRIGAATSASLAGETDENIATYGRWKSNSYKTYIRIPSNAFSKNSS